MAMLSKAYIAAAVCCAIPFLNQNLFFAMWLGLGLLLILQQCVKHKHRFIWLYATAFSSLAIAFYWAPQTAADAMGISYWLSSLLCLAILGFEALKIAVPIWLGVRCARGSNSAWLWAACFAILMETWFPSVFPWRLGHAFASIPILIQPASILGPSFPTIVAFAGAGFLKYLFRTAFLSEAPLPKLQTTKPIGSTHWRRLELRRRERFFGWLAGATLSANLLFGGLAMLTWQDLADRADHPDRAGSLRLVLVQANPGGGNGLSAAQELSEEALAELAEDEDIDLICWPESIGGNLDETSRPARITTGTQRPAPPVLLGANTDCDTSGHCVSALTYDAQSQALLGRVNKRFLMPFGEYIPFVHGLPSLQSMTGPWNLFEDECVQPIAVGKARLGVMLCYEDMIPRAARQPVSNGANVLFTLADGSAFRDPIALSQHRLLAQMRAVENRRTFVRCTSTGETCIISPTGSVLATLPKSKNSWLITEVDLYSTQSLYSEIGNQLPLISCLLIGFLFVERQRSRSKH